MAVDAAEILTPTIVNGLPTGWSWKRLDSVCEGVFDCPHSTPLLTQDGPFIARSQDMRSGVFRTDEAGHVSVETYRERVTRAEPKYGDLLYSREGTYFGIAAEVPRGIQVCLGQRMVLLRPHANEVNFRFLRYWLNSPVMAIYAHGFRDGTVAERLNLPTIRALPVLVPPLPEQLAIANILGTLDDKIELNRLMNETLETMARAIFKSWFVDLDPVRHKIADAIREGILEIGDGYRAKNSELGKTGLPFIRAGDLNSGFDTAGAELLTEESVARAGSKVCRVGDVAFTSKGTIGRFARVTEHTAKFVYSPQVCYWRSLDRARLQPVLLYCWMQSDDFREQITAVAGQTDMAPYVSLQDQRQMSMPIFPPSQHVVASRIEPLLARQSSNSAQTKTLAALRDTLLPKLISGDVHVATSSFWRVCREPAQ